MPQDLFIFIKYMHNAITQNGFSVSLVSPSLTGQLASVDVKQQSLPLSSFSKREKISTASACADNTTRRESCRQPHTTQPTSSDTALRLASRWHTRCHSAVTWATAASRFFAAWSLQIHTLTTRLFLGHFLKHGLKVSPGWKYSGNAS